MIPLKGSTMLWVQVSKFFWSLRRYWAFSPLIKSTSKLPMWCTDNIVIFYVRWFRRILYIYYSITVIKFVSNEFIIESNNYKLHIYISIIIIRNEGKKTILDEYCRIKINIECVFLFLLNSKTKYTSQTPMVNHSWWTSTTPLGNLHV